MLRLICILLFASLQVLSTRIQKRAVLCSSTEFLCLDGSGCVSKAQLCDGSNHCGDGSDLVYCAVQSRRKTKNQPIGVAENHCGKRRWQCSDGACIRSDLLCDGVADCPDGSDETFFSCSGKPCPETWLQCAYGACMEKDRFCNGEKDCVDGSDEIDTICKRSYVDQTCKVLGHPYNGYYSLASETYVKNKWDFKEVTLNITCAPGYGVTGRQNIICFNGLWSDEMPECSAQCKVEKQESFDYRCLITDDDNPQTRTCSDFEPSGTIVVPYCKTPDYYSEEILKPMTCLNGQWDYNATCKAECGMVQTGSTDLAREGNLTVVNKAPWHVAIYKRLSYQHICGGSIVSPTVVISAAQCFWDNVVGLLPAPAFAVAAGKLHHQWDNEHDTRQQKCNVDAIQIPILFLGKLKHWQHDIAIVRVITPFVYNAYVRPICLDFNFDVSDDKHLENNTYGKIAVWSDREDLQVLDLPYKSIKKCVQESSASLKEFITYDKICTLPPKGTHIGASDMGGGLVFPNMIRGTKRYFLQGIATSQGSTDTTSLFIHIAKYENFIKKFVK